MENLILVFGMPRSGTTWLAKIIDSHPNVIYRHEPDSERKILIPLVTNTDSVYAENITEFCDQLKTFRTARTCGKHPLFKKSYLNTGAYVIFKGSLLVAKLNAKFGLRYNIIEHINYNKQGLSFLWKSIESIGRVGNILDALPNAKMVYVIRHPYGQIASVLSGENNGRFTGITPASEDFGIFEALLTTSFAVSNGFTLEFLKALNPIQRLAIRWLLFNEHALTKIAGFKQRVYVVNYEELCSNPLKTAKSIFDFCQLEWNKQAESFVKNSTKENDGSYYGVFRNLSTRDTPLLTPGNKHDIKSILAAYSSSKCYKIFESAL